MKTFNTNIAVVTIPQTTGYPTIGRQDLLSNRQDSNLRADASNAPEINHSSTTRYLLPWVGSNHHSGLQRPMYCHYTTGYYLLSY